MPGRDVPRTRDAPTLGAVSRFLERLADERPLVCDGGMGALVSSAVTRLRCPEEANLRAPKSVVSMHIGYIRAGAELIETNTFAANRRKLRSRFLEDELRRINEAAVKHAREAREVSGRDVFIAGSIGALFAEQAELLEGRGVELFVLETFYDLDELETAVAAIRRISSLPIVALFTFDEEGVTLAGASAPEAAARAAALGVAAVGANHGSGPQAALSAIEAMSSCGRPLAALPNLGLASVAGGRIIYPHATPEYFAAFTAQARALGARLIGGCCGTTPLEIAAIRSALDEDRRPTAAFAVAERELAVAAQTAERGETRLQRDLREGNWIVSLQLDPPLGGDFTGLLDVARTVKESGLAGYLDINDNATATAKLNGMMMSAAIERRVGIETIPHLTTRDYSVLGLEALLLGG